MYKKTTLLEKSLRYEEETDEIDDFKLKISKKNHSSSLANKDMNKRIEKEAARVFKEL